MKTLNTKNSIKNKVRTFTVERMGKKVKLFSFRSNFIDITHCGRVASCDYFDDSHKWNDVYVLESDDYDYVYQNGFKIGSASNIKEFIDVVQAYFDRRNIKIK